MLCWISCSETRKNWSSVWSLGAFLVTVAVKLWCLTSQEKWARQIVTLQSRLQDSDFGLFMNLLGRSHGRLTWGAEWPIRAGGCLSSAFLKEQEWSISVCRKLSKYGRKTAWVCREFLSDLRCKKEVYRRWRLVKKTQEEQESFLPDRLQEEQERRCRELEVSQSCHIPRKIVKQTFMEAISKHMIMFFISTWIMVESTTSADLHWEWTSDTLESRAAVQRDVNRQKRSLLQGPSWRGTTAKSCIWDGITHAAVQVYGRGRTAGKNFSRKGHLEPGGHLKVEHESAVCCCVEESYSVLGCVHTSVATTFRKLNLFPLLNTVSRPVRGGPHKWPEDCNTSPVKKGWGSRGSAWRRERSGGPYCSLSVYRRGL